MADQSLEELFAQSIDSASVPYYKPEDLYKQAIGTPTPTPAPSTSVSTGASSNKQPNPILQEAQKAVKSYESAATAAIKKQEVISAQSAKASKEIVSSTESIGRAQEVIARQTGIAELENQKARMAAYEAAGGSEALIMLNKQLLADTKATQQAQAEVDKIEGRKVTGILDYIGQQLALIMPNDRLYNADQKRLETANLIATVTASQDRINKTILEHKKNVNTAIIEEQAKAAHALTTKNVSEAELKSLATNSAQLAAGMQASRDVLNSRLESYKLYAQEESRQQRQQEFDLQKQSLELRLKEYNLSYQKAGIDYELAQKRLAEATDPNRLAALQAQYKTTIQGFQDMENFRREATTNVKRAQAAFGLPVEDDATIMRMLTTPGKHKDRYEAMMKSGADPQVVAGYTPGEAAENLSLISPNGVQDSPSMKALGLVQAAVQAKHEEVLKKGGKLLKDSASLKAEFNQIAKGIFDNMAADIKTGDSSNFYQAPPMKVLADYATVQETPLWKNVLESRGLTEASPKNILKAAAEGINSGAITIEQAADGIEALYKAVVDYNNSHWNFKRVGLPEQTSYKTTDVIGRVIYDFTLSKDIRQPAVDMTDPVSIRSAISKYLVENFSYVKDLPHGLFR